MQKHQLYINLFTITSALALAACADEVDGVVTPDTPEVEVGEKTPIELTVGGVDSNQGAVTRAGVSPVITGGSDKTYKPFDKKTKIFMVMKSEYGTEDYLGSRKDKYTVSRGDVAAGETTISFDDLNKKYWDDAHARSSQLSIWAYAAMVQDSWNECKFQVPNLSWNGTDPLTEYVGNSYYTATKADDKSPYPWKEHEYKSDGTGDKGRMGAIYPCIMEWNVTHNSDKSQTDLSVQYQDLMFSNNLANNGEGKDGRLKFGSKTQGMFDAGEMKFYHAMSKITINIIEGDGFDKTSDHKDDDFQFKSNTNVSLKGFNTKGTFNIKNGYFEKLDATEGHYDIPKIALTSPKGADPNPYYTLQALAIPNINSINGQTDEYSRFVSVNTSVMMEFTIDNNTYKISSGDLYLALHGKGGATETTTGIIPLEAGKNYIFTFTVGKQKIKNISAQVADWETVAAEPVDITNARINLLMEERGSVLADNSVFSIYRKTVENTGTISDTYGDDKYDWKTGFTGTDASTTASYVAATTTPAVPAHWATSWYWPNNLTFYHLRSLGKATVSGSSTSMAAFGGGLNKDESNGDFASISSKLINATDYIDVCWGAPFTDDDKNEDPESFLFEYNKEKGFDVDRKKDESTTVKQLYHAVGSTKDAIKLIMFHMMSEVKFTVTTTAEDASDHVDFGDGTDGKVTKFELVGFKEDGLIRIGSGLVVATSDPSTAASPFVVSTGITSGNNNCTLGAVPQDLTGVKLVITTADHNKYEVDLKDLVSTVTSTVLKNPYTAASTGKYKIDRWYPGFKYNYSFKLTKKGIDQITATVVNWETVDAPEQEVQIQ